MPRCGGAFRVPGLVLEGVSMIPLAEMLSTQRRLLGRIVQDRTGFAGSYNIEFEFDFNASNQPDYSGPSIFTALKKQLGSGWRRRRGCWRRSWWTAPVHWAITDMKRFCVPFALTGSAVLLRKWRNLRRNWRSSDDYLRNLRQSGRGRNRADHVFVKRDHVGGVRFADP